MKLLRIAELEQQLARRDARILELEAVQTAEPVALQQSIREEVRDVLLFALWHHQGSSSQIGQSIRHALGIGQHDHLTEDQLNCARWVSSVLSAPQQAAAPEIDRLRAINAELVTALQNLNCVSDGGYCICPVHNGSAPDHKHSTACVDARAALAKAKS